MARPRVSVFYHGVKSYDCPQCKAPMDRTNRMGWFWGCDNCKLDFPLYMLEPDEHKRIHGVAAPLPPQEEKPRFNKPGLIERMVNRVKEAL